VQPPWRPFRDPARIWLNSACLPFGARDEDMTGTFFARQAALYLHQPRDKPFFLMVSFYEPHSPFRFPIENRGAYEPEQFAVPKVGPEDDAQIPAIFRGLTKREKQGIIAAYYTSTQFMDKNAGLVLDALKDSGRAADTLVIYTGDHGYMLGQHGRFEKHCGYDPALRVPLLMRFPGRVQPRVISDFTEHIDLPATILDMLEVDPLPITHGQSLRPYLERGRSASPRDHIFSEYLENEEAYIRTRRYKFIYCTGKRARQDGYVTDRPAPGRYVRLYDLQKDPDEFEDIAARAPRQVKAFEDLMLDRFRRTHPEAGREPSNASTEEALDFYLRPRDA
jgi:arylsulfatase A-like enzyme